MNHERAPFEIKSARSRFKSLLLNLALLELPSSPIEDAVSGLYFYNARYLEPGIGRFISPDSIIPNPSDPRDHNRYTYVRNNPLKYTDPTGHCSYAGEYAHCDYIEDGANYSFGVTTTFAEKRNEVHDEILDRYVELVEGGVGTTIANTIAVGWTKTLDSRIEAAQASARSDWEEQTGWGFGSGGLLETTEDSGGFGQYTPSTGDKILGVAEIFIGTTVATYGFVQTAILIAAAPESLGLSLAGLPLTLAVMYDGFGIANRGVCRLNGNCLDLPYIPAR
ncbi:RHS repeat-associated core domain-containing protein [Dehalococcoides mccartyi]|nr:RHS repeat-associated core domain-containing protein [Dehalococcoides mccartyi]